MCARTLIDDIELVLSQESILLLEPINSEGYLVCFMFLSLYLYEKVLA